MRVRNHLDKEQLQRLQKVKTSKKRKDEKIDWHDLMGVNRDTFKRGKGGAIRKR